MAIVQPRVKTDVPKTDTQAASRGALLLAVLAFAFAVSLTTFRTIGTFNVPGQTDGTREGMKDFRDAVYFPVVAYLAGVNPYGPDYQQFHPEQVEFPLFGPLTFLVHLPLGLLPFPWSAVCYFVIQILLLVGLAWLLLAACQREMNWAWVFVVAALIALSRPGHVNLWLGQLGLTMTLGCLLALNFAKSKPWLAGLAVALVCIKPNYALPLVVLMLCRRDFRAIAIGLTISAAGTAAVTAVLIARNGNVVTFFDQLLTSYGTLARHPGVATIDATSGRIDALSTVARFADAAPPAWFKVSMFVGCLLLAGAAVSSLSRKPTEQRADGLSAAIICLCILTCVYHNSYDAALLFIPAMAVLASSNSVWHSLASPARWLLAGLFALPLWNYISTRQVTSRLSLGDTALDWIMSLNSLVILLAFVVLACWALVPPRLGTVAADNAVNP